MTEKQRCEFEERAGILEFMANLPREIAEQRAREMLGLNQPETSLELDEYADFV